jgi:integrase
MTNRTFGQIVNDSPLNKYITLCKISPIGSLVFRKNEMGTRLYWRYLRLDQKEYVGLCEYDSRASPKSLNPTLKGYSFQGAMKLATELSNRHFENLEIGGHKGLIEEVKDRKIAEDQATKLIEIEAEAIKLDGEKHSFKALMDHYIEYQKIKNDLTAKQTLTNLTKNAYLAFPLVAGLPANQVTDVHVAEMITKIIERTGNDRSPDARKLRGAISKAYKNALESKYSYGKFEHLKGFKISNNPASATTPIRQNNDKNPLPISEMFIYWNLIKDKLEQEPLILQIHLQIGGQRIRQLLRLKKSQVNIDSITVYGDEVENEEPEKDNVNDIYEDGDDINSSLTLFDSKGNRIDARAHVLPLLPTTILALNKFMSMRPNGEFVFYSEKYAKTASKTIYWSTPNKWAKEIVGDQIQDFALKRVRSGVTTLLGALKVNNAHSDQVQSHDLTVGVRNKSYDGNLYLDEKSKALKRMMDFLNLPIKYEDGILKIPSVRKFNERNPIQ